MFKPLYYTVLSDIRLSLADGRRGDSLDRHWQLASRAANVPLLEQRLS